MAAVAACLMSVLGMAAVSWKNIVIEYHLCQLRRQPGRVLEILAGPSQTNLIGPGGGKGGAGSPLTRLKRTASAGMDVRVLEPEAPTLLEEAARIFPRTIAGREALLSIYLEEVRRCWERATQAPKEFDGDLEDLVVGVDQDITLLWGASTNFWFYLSRDDGTGTNGWHGCDSWQLQLVSKLLPDMANHDIVLEQYPSLRFRIIPAEEAAKFCQTWTPPKESFPYACWISKATCRTPDLAGRADP